MKSQNREQQTVVRRSKRTMRDHFQQFARATSDVVGSVWAFMAAILVIVLWVVSGPMFGFSDTWQLVINTGTTVITFMMVFLIQSTQNRDAKALHLKLDELLRATNRARNELVDLEDLTENELDALAAHFRRLHERALAIKGKKGAPPADRAGDESASKKAKAR